MRIGIDAAPVVGGAGGIGIHTAQLLRSMLVLDPTLEVVAYVPSGRLERVRPEEWVDFSGLQWKEVNRWGWKSVGMRDRLDLFHGPNFKMRTEGRYGGVVTIHDLWLDRHPEYSGKWLGQWWSGRRTKRTAWRARAVITVSEFSKREIVDLHGLPADRVVVIPNGVSQEFWGRPEGGSDRVLPTFRSSDAPYILFVGGADPRKNHRAALEAFADRRAELKPCRLVLVGDPVHRFGSCHDTVRALNLERETELVGRVGAEALRFLYRRAAFVLFPSLYEGFGMPVLEAMACGTPVITSSASSLPEVAGDAALLVDPHNPAALGGAIVRLYRDASLRAHLVAKGYERVKQFEWKRAAAGTLALYRRCCA